MEALRVGLLGLEGVGQDYAAALAADDRFLLVAIGERDQRLLATFAAPAPCKKYEDYRSLIVEQKRPKLDLLVVTLEPYDSAEFVLLAARQGVSVLHKLPLARTVEESRRLIGSFADNSASLHLTKAWRHDPAYAMLMDLPHNAGEIAAVDLRVRVSDRPVGWRGNALQAGGGVLLNGACDQLDLLVTLLGLPETVYTQTASVVPSGTARNYDTEDVASLTLRYLGGRLATLTAVRGLAHDDWGIEFFGAIATLVASPKGLAWQPRNDRRPIRCRVRFKSPAAAVLDGFAVSHSADTRESASAVDQHIQTLALIDAAYLSARTAAPESPQEFLR